MSPPGWFAVQGREWLQCLLCGLRARDGLILQCLTESYRLFWSQSEVATGKEEREAQWLDTNLESRTNRGMQQQSASLSQGHSGGNGKGCSGTQLL